MCKILNSLKTRFKALVKKEGGFTLPEMIVATGIILTVVSGFAVFMTGAAQTQRAAVLSRVADRVLAQQIELTNGLAWDNLMMAQTTGIYQDCPLNGDRLSTQSVAAGPERVKSGDVEVAVERIVTWEINGATVRCDANKDLEGLKVVKITVTWNNGTKQLTRSATILRSSYAEAPLSVE